MASAGRAPLLGLLRTGADVARAPARWRARDAPWRRGGGPLQPPLLWQALRRPGEALAGGARPGSAHHRRPGPRPRGGSARRRSAAVTRRRAAAGAPMLRGGRARLYEAHERSAVGAGEELEADRGWK